MRLWRSNVGGPPSLRTGICSCLWLWYFTLVLTIIIVTADPGYCLGISGGAIVKTLLLCSSSIFHDGGTVAIDRKRRL